MEDEFGEKSRVYRPTWRKSIFFEIFFRNGLIFFYFLPIMGEHQKCCYVINFFMNL